MKFSNLLNVKSIDKQKAFVLGMIYAWPIFSKDEKVILAYSGYKIETAPRMRKNLNNPEDYYIKKHTEKLKYFLGSEYNILQNKDIQADNFDQKILSGVGIVFNNDIEKEKVYGVIEKWLIDTTDNAKKYFLAGFMDGRGSLDFTAHYYTIDITQNQYPELAKRKIGRLNDILGLTFNCNPRILQANSSQKNDQFRMDMEYFAGHYGFFRPHIIEYYEKEKVQN